MSREFEDQGIWQGRCQRGHEVVFGSSLSKYLHSSLALVGVDQCTGSKPEIGGDYRLCRTIALKSV